MAAAVRVVRPRSPPMEWMALVAVVRVALWRVPHCLQINPTQFRLELAAPVWIGVLCEAKMAEARHSQHSRHSAAVVEVAMH